MSNMVLIRASRCIYAIPLYEWKEKWKMYFPYVEEWSVTVGEKYVTFEYKEHCYRMDEKYFNTLLAHVPYSARKQALKRGKGVLRTESSYSKKGVSKHASHTDR